jgi:intracellular sulfur oxidation DsrE/DsrF family protein
MRLLHAALVTAWVGALGAGPAAADPLDGNGLRVDVPVVLKEAKVVLNLDHRAIEGDEPTGLDFLRLLVDRFRTERTKSRIVAIFHGAAGYILLDDAAYNGVRNRRGGNPYKDQIAALQRDGVEVEECGETMARNHWTNAQLMSGVKVNSGANFRILQLVQLGYIQLQP